MQLSQPDRRCLSIFKTFVDKVFLPQIKQANGSLAQWKIFDSLISAPNINLNEIQHFVQSLPPNQCAKNQRMTLTKKQLEIEQIARQISQLNKTFGGEKNRNSMGSLTTFGDQFSNNPRRDSAYEEQVKGPKAQNTSGILTDLSRLLKTFEQNQISLENIAQQYENNQVHKQNRPVLNQLSYNSSPSNTNPSVLYSGQSYFPINNNTKTSGPVYFRNIQ